MRIATAFLLIALAGPAWQTSRADTEVRLPKTKLALAMDTLADHLKALVQGLATSPQADLLAHVKAMKEAATIAREELPPKALVSAEKTAEYKGMIDKLASALDDLERAISQNEKTDIKKALAALDRIKKAGHKAFKPPEKP